MASGFVPPDDNEPFVAEPVFASPNATAPAQRSDNRAAFWVIGIVLLFLFLVVCIAGGLIVVGVYFLIQEERTAMLKQIQDVAAEAEQISSAEVDSEFRTTPDETLEVERAATQVAYALEHQPLEGANIAQLEQLLQQTTVPRSSNIEDLYDLSRYYKACQSAGMPYRFGYGPGDYDRVARLQAHFEAFDLVDVKAGQKSGELILSAYAWDVDEICSMIRVWVIRRGSGYKIFDWEDVEFDLRASEIEVHVANQTLGGRFDELVDQIDDILVRLDDAGEDQLALLEQETQRFHQITSELRSPIADILHIKTAYAWTHFNDSEKAHNALNRVVSASGQLSTDSFVLRYSGQNVPSIRSADRFNQQVGEFPEVSIDRIDANGKLERPFSSPERLSADLRLLRKYAHRASRIRSTFELGCLQWNPELLTEELATMSDADAVLIALWDNRGWLASQAAVSHLDQWLAARPQPSPEILKLQAELQVRLDRKRQAIQVLRVAENQLLAEGEDLDESHSELLYSVHDQLAALLLEQGDYVAAMEVDPDPESCLQSCMMRLLDRDKRWPGTDASRPTAETAGDIWEAYTQRQEDQLQRQYQRGRWHLWQGEWEQAETQWEQLLETALAGEAEDYFPDFESDLIEVMVWLERSPDAFDKLASLDPSWLPYALSTGFYQGLPMEWIEPMLAKAQASNAKSYPDWEAELVFYRGAWERADELMVTSIQELDEDVDSSALERLRAFFWMIRGEATGGYQALGSNAEAFDIMLDLVRENERFELLDDLVTAHYPAPGVRPPSLDAWIARDLLTENYDALLQQLPPEAVELGISDSEFDFDQRREWWRQRLVAELMTSRADKANQRWAETPEPLRDPLWGVLIQMALDDVDSDGLGELVAERGDWLESTEHYGLGRYVTGAQIAKLADIETPNYPSTNPWFNLTLLQETPIDDAIWQDWQTLLQSRADEGTQVTAVSLAHDDDVSQSLQAQIDHVRIVVTRGSQPLRWSGDVPKTTQSALQAHTGWVSIDTYLTVNRPWQVDSSWQQRSVVFSLAQAFEADTQAVAWLQGRSGRVATSEPLKQLWQSYNGIVNWSRDLIVDPEPGKSLYEIDAQLDEQLRIETDAADEPLSRATIAQRLVGQTVIVESDGITNERLPCDVLSVELTDDGEWLATVVPRFDSLGHQWVLKGTAYRANLDRIRLADSLSD